jgi:hypothetical protein
VPHWAKDLEIGSRMINARAETVATLPAFRDAFKARRCIIPASEFYEWKKTGQVRYACAWRYDYALCVKLCNRTRVLPRQRGWWTPCTVEHGTLIKASKALVTTFLPRFPGSGR